MLSQEVVNDLQAIVEKAVADPTKGIPGTSVCVVGKDGKNLFSLAAGKRGLDTQEPMTTDSIFWIASCTKMITGVACMQLVEQGLVFLDNPECIKKYCPELTDVKVLTEDGSLVEKKQDITLRMLLTHTAGFGYAFFNEKLRRYSFPLGFDEFSGRMFDMSQPLVNQPGERWEYGINLDWAGFLVQRVTKMSLNDYFQKHIFEPLGLKEMTMFPSEELKARIAYMHQRADDGTLTGREHLARSILTLYSGDIPRTVNSGGAGCFAKPEEYCQILATLLNDGTSPKTGKTILSAATVKEMFTNQIPQFPNFGRVPIAAAKPDLTVAIPELYSQPADQEQGWGLTFFQTIHPGATGRAANTVHWAGIANLWWWCDREKGVAGMICTQILPFGDAQVANLWATIESVVYKGLS